MFIQEKCGKRQKIINKSMTEEIERFIADLAKV
jgi:hypothetical protein